MRRPISGVWIGTAATGQLKLSTLGAGTRPWSKVEFIEFWMTLALALLIPPQRESAAAETDGHAEQGVELPVGCESSGDLLRRRGTPNMAVATSTLGNECHRHSIGHVKPQCAFKLNCDGKRLLNSDKYAPTVLSRHRNKAMERLEGISARSLFFANPCGAAYNRLILPAQN